MRHIFILIGLVMVLFYFHHRGFDDGWNARGVEDHHGR